MGHRPATQPTAKILTSDAGVWTRRIAHALPRDAQKVVMHSFFRKARNMHPILCAVTTQACVPLHAGDEGTGCLGAAAKLHMKPWAACQHHTCRAGGVTNHRR